MENEDSFDFVTDLACILEIFFKGLSECGILSTYSMQLQTAVSDMTVHLKFRQHIYQIMKSLQVLLQRISRIPGGKSISIDQTTQTESSMIDETKLSVLKNQKFNKSVSRKASQKISSNVPFRLMKSSPKNIPSTKVRPCSTSLTAESLIEACTDLGNPLQQENSSATIDSLKDTDSLSPSHTLLTEEIQCSPTEVSCLPHSPSHLELGVHSSTHISRSSDMASQISSTMLEERENAANERIYPRNVPLEEDGTSPAHHKNSEVLPSSNCQGYSSVNQMHSLEASSELVAQDLIGVLDAEDVSGEQQGTVLFLRAEDAGEEISRDDTEIPEEHLENGNISIEEEVERQNIQHDSSIYPYSTITEKEDSISNKSLKSGLDIVSSLRDHEEDLGLFCKDDVELDAMNSVSVESVEKEGELMSIFASDNGKEDEENSTVLYVNGDMLNPKKVVHLANAINRKNTLDEHFFEEKADSRNSKKCSFALLGIKMGEGTQGESDDGTHQFQDRGCSRDEPCEASTDKEVRLDNDAVIGLEDVIDPEDELGQNFVHIVVTATRVIPEKPNEGKLEDLTAKPTPEKRGKKGKNKNECRCTTCETTFPTLSSLQNHLKKKHGNFSQCDLCQKVFPTIGGLIDHYREVHDGVGCFECEECGKRLKSRLSLRRHQESHQGRKEAVCHECGKTFCRGDYLVRHHQMVHAGERPFQCTQCSQRFLTRGHLRNHIAIHTGERNHKCGICGKLFGRSDKLREHVLRHLSAKRHTCPSCGRSYADKRDLNKHQMREPGCHSVEAAPIHTEAIKSTHESQS